MSHFDAFNGDADGLCALQQLRLAQPCDAVLVSGVKRDNTLVSRVPAGPGDTVTVLDVSLDNNLGALMTLLDRGAAVEYFDHHHAPEKPRHPRLRLYIDTSPRVCTSILVDRHLRGRFRPWAVVGAFGDNLVAVAWQMARELGLDEADIERLRRLGECLNYNGYGETEDDLLYRPAALHRVMRAYAEPLKFIAGEAVFDELERQRARDLESALAVPPLLAEAGAMVFLLPAAAWGRRVMGALANRLQADQPHRAYAVLVPDTRGTLSASLRVPAEAAVAADEFARRYGGNGRRTAAGADRLSPERSIAMGRAFVELYSSPTQPAERRDE